MQMTNNNGAVTTPLMLSGSIASHIRMNRGFGNSVLILCGALHYSWKENALCGLWTFFVYFLATSYLVVSSIIMINEIVEGNYSNLIWYLAFIFQAIIVWPVVVNARKRLVLGITATQASVLAEAIEITAYYLLCAIPLCLAYSIVTLTFQARDNDAADIMMLVGIGSLTPLGITFLNGWALFFIVLDAKVSQVEIRGLMDHARNDTLTLRMYDDAYDRHKVENSSSLVICEGVAVVAYFSMLIFLCALILFSSEDMDRWIFILCVACLQFREAILMGFVLPQVAEVNELHDQLCHVLARSPNHGSNFSQEELCRVFLWISAMDRPLTLKILGRVIKRLEMKAQLTTFAILALGSFTSFLTDHAFNEAR